MKEIWKEIKGYEGFYEVSNTGCVRSLDRLVNSGQGWFVNRKGKVIKSYVTGQRRNYLAVQLNLNGKMTNKKIHRLVAEEFCEGKSETRDQVNHIDGNTLNNNSENLEWCSCAENQRHAIETGLLVRGQGVDCPNTKYKTLVFKDGIVVKELIGTKAMIEFGLQPAHVASCISGKRKSHKGFTYKQVMLFTTP